MTKTELHQKLLFACMQNPALVNEYKIPLYPEHPEVAKMAVYVALDTADYIIHNLGEDFGIDYDSE